MKVKRIVIPFLTLVLIVGQITGCAPLTSQEAAEINQETPEVIVEVAEPQNPNVIDELNKPAVVTEESREEVEDGTIVTFSDGTTEFISNDTIVPEIVDIETLEEMGLREPEVKEPEASEKPKETYDNPIIQADSETYVEYLGETISLKDYYEEIIRMDPEGCIKDGMIERVIAYMPDWAAEHGYSLDDVVKEQEPEKPATTNIEDNHITPAPDPSYITPDNGSLPYEPAGKDEGYIGTIESAGGIDWGDVPPELRPTFK